MSADKVLVVPFKAILCRDRNDPNTWRVEAVDSDGGVEVAIFSGPRAKKRAIAYARKTITDLINEGLDHVLAERNYPTTGELKTRKR